MFPPFRCIISLSWTLSCRVAHLRAQPLAGAMRRGTWPAGAADSPGVLVYMDDLDAHYERARLEGATMLSAPEDGPPGRRYRAEDLEGHRWFFFQQDE